MLAVDESRVVWPAAQTEKEGEVKDVAVGWTTGKRRSILGCFFVFFCPDVWGLSIMPIFSGTAAFRVQGRPCMLLNVGGLGCGAVNSQRGLYRGERGDVYFLPGAK